MIWTETNYHELYSHLLKHVADPLPPDIYELALAEQAKASVRTDLLEGWRYRVHPESGAISILLDSDDDAESAMASAQQVAYELDPERTWFRWEDLDDEEQPGPLVLDELVTDINGVRAIGPGGRIRRFRQSRGQLLEIVVRPRINTIPSTWRPLTPIVDSVNEAAADQAGTRLRFAFGYHEASGYEEQRWLRAVFVFLIEQKTGDARWRIALVEPATVTDELPADAGLENVLGRCP